MKSHRVTESQSGTSGELPPIPPRGGKGGISMSVLLCVSVSLWLVPPAWAQKDMDYGPFLTGSLDRDPKVSEKQRRHSTEQTGKDENHIVSKAINIRAGDGTVTFDTDLVRYAIAWTGGFLNLKKTHQTSGKGVVPLSPAVDAKILFESPKVPGGSGSDTFEDPRKQPFGPVPKRVAHYKGLYRHGTRVILKYTVGETEILDSPEWVGSRFDRTIQIRRSERKIWLLLGPSKGLTSAATGLPSGARVFESGGLFVLEVPALSKPARFKVALSRDRGSKPGAAEDLSALLRGGPALWPETVELEGKRGTGDGPYVVDTVTLPFDNPWNSWIRTTGFDFFPGGTQAAVCTWSGDVWTVSGIGGDLGRLVWKRFAAGLYEPLGLKIVDGTVYVTGRDQITRLHDLNGDGEADFYENFNNDRVIVSNYHAFAFDLQTDSKGNFYYAADGHRVDSKLPHNGSIIRVSPDGSRMEVFCAGFRAPNGMSIGPGDVITTGDNQGCWTPTSPIKVVEKGGFYGYMPHVTAAGGPPRKDYDPPMCWIPYAMDNSSGGQVWVTSKRWGPFEGRLLHLSYGKASLFLAFMEDTGKKSKVSGVTLYQGGVLRLPLRFESGISRGRFNPKDGQLYLSGIGTGWQTSAPEVGCLHRVRYVGKPVVMASEWRVRRGGVAVTFTQQLDPASAGEPDNWALSQWTYRWAEDYGSKDYSVKNPKKQGRDSVEVTAARLEADGRTVFLEIPGLKPVMQMEMKFQVKTKDGTRIRDTIWNTIHHVPD